MSDQKISALTALTGANVVTSTDSMPIVDSSASQTKQILVSELIAAMGPLSATQAQMEQATSTNVFTSPGNEHFHPGVPKAWGSITTPTTVSLSYPAAGVSVVRNSAGSYTVTHGRTMSGTTYAILVTHSFIGTLTCGFNNKTATAVDLLFYDALGNLTEPNAFSYVILGDL